MTIDEAINHAKEVASELKRKSDFVFKMITNVINFLVA